MDIHVFAIMAVDGKFQFVFRERTELLDELEFGPEFLREFADR